MLSLVAIAATVTSGTITAVPAKILRKFADDEIDEPTLYELKEELNRELVELRTKVAGLEDKLASIPTQDTIIELGKAIQLYQDGLLLDNEPFPNRLDWIEALNIRGELSGTRKERLLTVITDWGRVVLLLGTPLPTSNDPHSSRIHLLVSIHTLAHWRSNRPESSAHWGWWS
jgi:hypothetical protein